ncbi:MerR family transcriptional regulator [bacterium]|nr:MerR family transcriptional regulator [bacterium]
MNLNPSEPFYQISQAAKLLDITSDRLRTYEEEGLIKPYRTKQSKEGKRLFSKNDIEWLSMIRDLIKLGVSIPTIRILLLSDYPITHQFYKNKDTEIVNMLKKLKSHCIYSILIED